jgi:hypothetical protein
MIHSRYPAAGPRGLAWFAGLIVLGAAAAASAQMPDVPKPGPEQEVLKRDVGTWDALIEINPGPDMPPMKAKGVETNALECGGFCLVSEFKGEIMPGVPFAGRGLTTWDPMKRKFVGSWIDSMNPGMGTSEMDWDAKANRASGWMESPNASTGSMMKLRTVVEYQADGKRVMSSYMTDPGGGEVRLMRITYTRRK